MRQALIGLLLAALACGAESLRVMTFNVSALLNGGVGVVRAPDPGDHEQPGDRRLDRLRYGLAANVRSNAAHQAAVGLELIDITVLEVVASA